jgi:hypothetical protein
MSGSTSNNNVIGSGSDTFTLNMAEDQALGVDAEFTVNVDGQQIGGVQTVTAAQSSGQTEPFTFAGNWGPGNHDITVSFVNNFIYPGLSGDRNVYVDGLTYDGQTVSNTTTPLYQTPFFPPNSTTGNNYGNAVFSVNDTTSVPSGAPSTPTTTPAAVSVGSGPDTLVLNMAEDPYQGDAQFTVSVDGQQIGGTQTTTAVVDQGQFQEFDVHGNFGPGNHTVSVDFLNDAIGGYYPDGTPGVPSGQWALDSEDRNLYVMGMSLDGGTPASGAPWEISSDGTANFSVTSGSNPSATAFNSGLFATDGAAATSDNAAIPSGSLSIGSSSSGSSSGMSFVAPTSSTSATTASAANTSDPSSSSDPASTSSATSTTPSVAAAASSATQSPQDFTVPSASSASGSTTNTSSGTATGSTWWTTHQTAHVAGSGFHQHG